MIGIHYLAIVNDTQHKDITFAFGVDDDFNRTCGARYPIFDRIFDKGLQD